MRRQGMRTLLVVIVLASFPTEPVYTFAGAGPWSHISITAEAIRRFSKDTGWDLDPICAEILAQGSVVSDNVAGMEQWTYHCDSNDLAGCSFRLDQFKSEANRAINRADSLMTMGRALHIVQDFYAHTNWVETYKFTMPVAPISRFKDIPPPVDLQSGYFPDIFPDLDAQIACFETPEADWDRFIYGATHACLNKDSNITFRGGREVPYAPGYTYHTLAAEYAIVHSVEILKYFWRHNGWLQTCGRPNAVTRGCGSSFVDGIR